jgi:hypothetical protein
MQVNKKIINRLAYDLWRRILPRYGNLQNGASILECGIGPGNLINLMSGWFPRAELYGLDIDLQAIQQAREPENKISLLAASSESLPFQERILIWSSPCIWWSICLARRNFWSKRPGSYAREESWRSPLRIRMESAPASWAPGGEVGIMITSR